MCRILVGRGIMNTEILNALKLIQSKLNKGDQITIWSDEFQIALDGQTPTTYVDEVEDPNQLELDV
jgi:hypothetical protein